MKKDVFTLCSEILELIKVQRNALLEGRVEEAWALQERRQNIIGKIQNIDRKASPANLGIPRSIGKNDPEQENFSRGITTTVEEILSLDREMRTIIQSELGSISEQMELIRKAKAFCRNLSAHQTAETLHISI